MGKFVDSIYNPDKTKEVSEERLNLHRRAVAIKEKWNKMSDTYNRLVREDPSLNVTGPLARCVKSLMDISEGSDEKNKAFLRAVKTPEGEAEVYFKIVKMGLEQNIFKTLSLEEMLEREEANPGFSALVYETQNVTDNIRNRSNPYISRDVINFYSANKALLQGRNEYNNINLMAFEEWVYADDIDTKNISYDEMQDEITSAVVMMQNRANDPITGHVYSFVANQSAMNTNAKIENLMLDKGIQLDENRNAAEFSFKGVVDGVEKTFTAQEMYRFVADTPTIPDTFTVNRDGAEKLDRFAEAINNDIPFVNRMLAVDARKQLYTPDENMQAAHDASVKHLDRVERCRQMWEKVRDANPALSYEASSPFSRIMYAFMNPDEPLEKNVETALRLKDPENRTLEIYKLIKTAREMPATASLLGKDFTDAYCREDMLFEKLMVLNDLIHEPGMNESVRNYCSANIATFTGIDPSQLARVYATDEWLYSGDVKDVEKDFLETAVFASKNGSHKDKELITLTNNYASQRKFFEDTDKLFKAFENNNITKEQMKSLDRYQYSLNIMGQQVNYKYSEIENMFTSGKIQVEEITIIEKPLEEQSEFDKLLDEAIAVSENMKKDYENYSPEGLALAIRSNEAMLQSRDYDNLDYGFFSFGKGENKAAIKNFKDSFKEFNEGLKTLYEEKGQISETAFKRMLLDNTNEFLITLDSTIRTLKSEPGEERRLEVLNTLRENLNNNLELDKLIAIVGREDDAMTLESIANDAIVQQNHNAREQTVDVIREAMTEIVWERFAKVKDNNPKYADYTKDNIAALMSNHSKFMDMTLEYIDNIDTLEGFAETLSEDSADYKQSVEFLEGFVNDFSSHLEDKGLSQQAQQHLEKDTLVQIVSLMGK